MEVVTDQVVQQCIDAINERINSLKKLNIIVIGKTGVGKSTLINSLFRGNLAETGVGRPVTTKIQKIEKSGFPLVVYDTPGFELSEKQQNKVKEEIIDLINKGAASKDINQTIHCIWYCIEVGIGGRFEEEEKQWLKSLTESNRVTRVPVIVVLTKAFPKKDAKNLQSSVEKENLDIIKVVPVLAQDILDEDEEGEPCVSAKAYGLETLVDIMSEALPEELQDTLQNLQKVSLKAKKRWLRQQSQPQ